MKPSKGNGLSAAQKALHWRLWKAAVERQGWKPVEGRIHFDDARMTREGRIVATIAEELSVQAHRAVSLDDLRHGLYRLALGKVCSFHQINRTRQFDQVKGQLQLLADENSLRAARTITDTDANQRKRYVVAIRQVLRAAELDESYALAIVHARRDWGLQGEFWEDLPLWALEQLLVTLKNRARQHADQP